MPRKARSARGVIVDFDLMKIKEQIASAPTPIDVKTRQDFIENRVKRRLKKVQTTAKVETTSVEAEPELPEPSTAALDAVDSAYIEDEKSDDEKKSTKKKTTKQKARPTKSEK